MRHHCTPQNAQPILVLDASGPIRVEIGDDDPEFTPRPVGFLAQLDEQDQSSDPVSPGQPGEQVGEPLLWDGDQA